MLPDSNVALDCLIDAKTTVVELTKAVLESSNPNLRQTLIQMRNQAEKDQEEIYHIAERTGGYMCSGPADHQDISRVDNFFRQWGTPTAQQVNQQFQYHPVNQGMVSTQVGSVNQSTIPGVGTTTSASNVSPQTGSQYSHY